MPKRLVRHALITYVVDDRQEMAFRGQTVTLSTAEAERFDGLGATVPAGSELDRPGTLLALPESPTDEELVAWTIAATEVELRATLSVRPELGPRIEGAKAHVVDARAAQDKALAAASKAASGAPAVGYLKRTLGTSEMLKEDGPSQSPRPTGSGDGPEEGQGGDTPLLPPTTPSAPAGSDGNPRTVTVTDPNEAGPPVPAGMGTESHPAPGAEGTLPNTTAEVEEQAAADDAGAAPTEAWVHVGDDDPNRRLVAQIVVGNVDDVQEFIGENPELASLVLEAETTARQAAGKGPRAGVVKAAEAAAGHTQ